MLVVEEQHGPVELVIGPKAYLASAGALNMAHYYCWIIDDLVARGFHPQHPVEVLAVKEEIFIKKARGGNGFPTDEHESANDRVHFGHLIGVSKRQVVPTELGAVREYPTQAQEPVGGHLRRREGAAAGEVEASIGTEELWANHTYVLMAVEELDLIGDGVCRDDHIGVAEEHVTGWRFRAKWHEAPQSEVVSIGVATVYWAHQEPDFRELVTDHPLAAIIRGVIHNADL
jgi:hypothetical protein